MDNFVFSAPLFFCDFPSTFERIEKRTWVNKDLKPELQKMLTLKNLNKVLGPF